RLNDRIVVRRERHRAGRDHVGVLDRRDDPRRGREDRRLLPMTSMPRVKAPATEPLSPTATPADTPTASMVSSFFAVAVSEPPVSDPRRSVPSTPASVCAEIWLKPIDAPIPTPPLVNEAPPPIAIIVALFSASRSTAFACVTVTLSSTAPVVSR